jgi:hypothetical protein
MMQKIERPAQGRPALPFYFPAALALLAALMLPGAARAQWTQPDANGNISSTNSGNVGIGTASPAAKLDIQAPPTATPLILFRQGSAAGEAVQLGVFNAPGSSGSTIFNVARLMAGTNGVSSAASYIEFQPINTNGSGWASGLSVRAGGKVGIGTTIPTFDLSFGGNAGRVIWMERNTAANTAGNNLVVQAGGAAVGATDKSGGDLVLGSGAGTGVGGSNITFVTGTPGASGTSDTAVTEKMRITGAGLVGIGTTAPGELLDLFSANTFPRIKLTGNAASGVLLTTSTAGSKAAALIAGSGGSAFEYDSSGSFNILRATKANVGNGGGTPSLTIDGSGNVGVGTTPAAGSPYKLDVSGAAHVGGDITVDGNISAKFQDVAEWVPSSQKLSAGTIVVLDTNKTNHVLASTKAYDTGVAGVVSDSPGVILGQGGADKVKVATTGRVKVRVDATRAPIRVGDLLVTSEAEGVAMKSVPVDLGGVQIHRPGTIIGKALEPLEKGTGEILVLLSLQ